MPSPPRAPRPTRKPIRPSPGSENVRPTSGVPTRIVRAANMLIIPTAAPGASGTSRAAPASDAANGSPAASPTTTAAAIANGNGLPIASTATAPPPTRKLRRSEAEMARDTATERTRHHARKEDERAGDSRDPLGVAARSVQERHHPVAEDDRQAERRREHRCQREQPAVGHLLQLPARCAAGSAHGVPAATSSNPASAMIADVANGACQVPQSGTRASASPPDAMLQPP